MANPQDFDFYCEVALQPNAQIVKEYESESVLAFHHTKPLYEKHIVIVPKKHIHDLRAVEDTEIFKELFAVAQKILNSWETDEVEAKGARVITNLGKFQDTPHLHFHVVMGRKIKKVS